IEYPVRGILDLRALDNPKTDSLSTLELATQAPVKLLGVIALVRAWERKVGQPARLVLATRGAQSVGDRPEPVELAQAPLLGLGRVIVNECALLNCRLVD